jgi:hypothetical protein
MRNRYLARRASFYAGLGFVTAATLMLQIVETRIISVTSWYHLAFFVISIAMFGLTAGAVWVYLRAPDYRSDHLSYHLTVASLAFALTMVGALLVQLTIVTSLPASVMSLVVWTEFAVALSIPFFFSGVVVSLALTRSPYPIGIVYGADLVGAAAGCLLVLALLNAVSGPSAILWIAVMVAAGGLLFARSAIGDVPNGASTGSWLFRRRWLVFASLAALAVGNAVSPAGVRPTIVKDSIEHPDRIAYEKWNSFSRVTVEHSGHSFPAIWGPSPRMPDLRVEQRWMNMDGGAGTAVYRYTGDLGEVSFLRYDVTNLAYAAPGLRRAAVVGVGGGRDLLSARLFGIPDVTGIEINPTFIDILERRFSDYTALARQPGIALEVEEARSWFARTTRSFDIIQMSLIDTWAATGAGAFTLSENGLYTVEAWRIFLQKLDPGGLFTVSRWYAPGEVNETGRMVSLAVATLHSFGVAEPKRHIFVGAAGSIATLIISAQPLSSDVLSALRHAAQEHDFKVLIDPDRAAVSQLLEDIVSARDANTLDMVTRASTLDLSAPTDARPFFFNQLRISRVLDPEALALSAQGGVYGGNLVATLTLGILILISAILVVVTIVVPLRSSAASAGKRVAVAGTAYFALIGVGFMMAEIGLLQRMSVFLGHPIYSLSIVLFSLILSTGIGSILSERIALDDGRRLTFWAALTGFYLFVLPSWLPDMLLRLESAPLLTRASFAVLVLSPAGVLMGFGFPTGMRLVSRIDPGPTPWLWGVNGAAGVLAASIAVVTSIAVGIDTTLRVGAMCYLMLPMAALFLMDPAARGRSAA